MSPFREAPLVELGPLQVGLAVAADRAHRRLPRGGRLVTPMRDGEGARLSAGHARRGAIGSGGLVLLAAAVLAWAKGVRPPDLPLIPAVALAVLMGGLSLALVLRAIDRGEVAVVREGDVIRQRASSVLHSLAGLETHADRAFADPRSIHWLRRVLTAAADADIEPWIPADVRGRAELLLAREIAAYQGHALADRRAVREEIAGLLTAATSHLDDASPARSDLAALEQSPCVRVHRARAGRPDGGHPHADRR
jgi:hypothetical protein